MAAKKTRAAKRVATPAPPSSAELLREVLAVVKAVPRGKVMTYGQVAELAGRPQGHRFVARAMRSCPKGLPWQRIVARHDARRARIAILDPEGAALQRKLLTKEGVVFDDRGLIVLAKSGWLP
jgi:methylated-DNA-protein-cysteine methyltransferase-like protein